MQADTRETNIKEVLVVLDETDMREKTVLPFYVYVAQCMGHADEEVENYDCRKIWVAENVLDAIIEAYQKKFPVEYSRTPNLVNQEIMMTLAMSGPKTDCRLEDNHVRVEAGFITLKKAEVGNADGKAS